MRRHWTKWWWGFVAWIISAADPLHDGAPYMMCDVDAVDDAIRRDFETMPYHLFQENYRDILTKYLAHLSRVRNADGTRKYADNTVRAYISSIRSFFTTEAASVKLQNGKVPKVVRARDEHVFTHDYLNDIWDLAGGYEEKAMLSTAVSLGWSIGDFKQLTVAKIRDRLNLVRPEGFVVFETQRQKTGALTVGILNPSAIRDLAKYVEQVPPEQTRLWRILQ